MSKKTNYKFMAGAVTAAMVASAVAPVAGAEEVTPYAETAFSDVGPDYTHFEAINKAVENEFMSGYTDGTFKPLRTLSRGDVVKSLGKYVVAASGKDKSEFDLTDVEPFNDVTSAHRDQELYTYSLIVKQAGIFDGSNNNLMPGNSIARQQLAKVLVNAFKLKDLEGDLSIVTDNDQAFDEFVPFIDILSENEVTIVPEFMPLTSAVRGQFAALLVRAYEAAMEVPAEVVAINAADTAAALDTAFLPFKNENYINLGTASRLEVAEAFLAEHSETSFTTKDQVVKALEKEIADYRNLLSGVNNATSIAAIDKALDALDFVPYNDLSAAEQLEVAEIFLTAFNQRVDGDGNRILFSTLEEIEDFLLETGSLAPVVTGVKADETYYNTTTPVFGREATATLSRNGGSAAAFVSGTDITEDGNYVLTVSSPGGDTVVEFEVIRIDSAAELNELLASDEETITLGGNITDADGTRIIISDAVTLNGGGFSVDAPIEISAEAEGTNVNNITVETGDVSGGEDSGFYVVADKVVLNTVTVNGSEGETANGIDSPVGTKTITVTNSKFNDLLRGINLNSNDLVATGNTFTDVDYGIGGTENSAITVTGNSFVSGIEGIGLGAGVTVAGVEQADLVDYLEENNNFKNVRTGVADYR